MLAYRTFETCRPPRAMSVSRGRPEVLQPKQKSPAIADGASTRGVRSLFLLALALALAGGIAHVARGLAFGLQRRFAGQRLFLFAGDQGCSLRSCLLLAQLLFGLGRF